jgi:hypothetical protein
MKNRFILGLALASASFVNAQDSAKVDSDALSKNNFKLEGYLDFYYLHNLNNPQSGSNLGSSGYERAFDQKSGQFQIGLVQTKMTYSHKKSEAVVDLVFGPHADLGNFGNTVGPLGATTALAIKQAYFNWKATDKFTVTAGQFGTHIGYEVIDAPTNFHYSLNNLFTNGPFYHIGLKGTYAFNDKLSLMAGVVNNWDNLYDNNQFKTVISQLQYAPGEKTNLYLNYIIGNEVATPNFNAGDNTYSMKQALDLVGTFDVSDKFNIGINAIYGQLGFDLNDERITRNWGGAALYLKYAATDKFAIGTRVDFLDNTQGVQGIGNTDVVSGTLTAEYTAADGHLLIKPEVRFDGYKKIDYTGAPDSDVQQFMDSEGNNTKSSQVTVGLAFVYKF